MVCLPAEAARSYRRKGLVARFGAYVALPDLLLVALASMRSPARLLSSMRRSVYGSDRAISDGQACVLVNYRRENGECNYCCGCGFDQ